MHPLNAGGRGRARPLSRRPAWVLACLGLLMAVVLLRGWVSADMMVAMAAPNTAVTLAHTAKPPPCHAHADEAHGEAAGTEADGGAATCGCCAFCTPALAAVVPAAPGMIVVREAARTMPVAVLAAGDPEPFFRPPRG